MAKSKNYDVLRFVRLILVRKMVSKNLLCLFVIVCSVLMFSLTVLTNSEATGYLKYYDKAHEILNELDQILVKRGICKDINDCRKKQVLFASWESWGIGIDIHGIKM